MGKPQTNTISQDLRNPILIEKKYLLIVISALRTSTHVSDPLHSTPPSHLRHAPSLASSNEEEAHQHGRHPT